MLSSALRAEPATVPFIREPCSWTFLFADFVKPASRTARQTMIQKTSPQARQIDQKYGLGPSRGLSGETWGPFWSQGGPRLKNGSKKPRNPSQFFGTKIETRTSFSWSCSLLFLGFFIIGFVVLGARSLHVGSFFGSILRALGLENNSWNVVRIVNFRILTTPRRSLFADLGRGCVSMMICFCTFHDLLLFWVLVVSFLRIAPAWKGGLWKPLQQKNVKRGARILQVIPCGSL